MRLWTPERIMGLYTEQRRALSLSPPSLSHSLQQNGAAGEGEGREAEKKREQKEDGRGHTNPQCLIKDTVRQQTFLATNIH